MLRWNRRSGEMLHLCEQGGCVFDTAARPGGLDLDDHSMDLVEKRLARLLDAPSATAA